MRLAVTLDKLERGFTNFSDLQPNRRFGRRSRLMFPSSQTLPTDTIDMKAVLRRAFICLLLVAALYAGIIFLFVTAIAVTTLFLFLHRIHHLHWRLLKLIYKFAFHVFFNHDPPMQYVFAILVFGVLGLVWLILLRWAWNRRADRLNREGVPSEAAPLVVSGVWPPPPNVPEARTKV